MQGINKVILIGNVGNIDTKYLPSGDAVCNLSLATNEKWKDKNGETVEATEWHRVVMFRRLAEIAGEYVRKGDSLYIEGKNKTRSYERDGVKMYSTEIDARSMQMLGGSRKPASQPTADIPPADGFEDDIPF